jgi:hypothetical protein
MTKCLENITIKEIIYVDPTTKRTFFFVTSLIHEIRLTRTKAMPITETQNTPYTPETERPHTSLSRASSLPVNMTTFAIERDPLPIGSDLFQTVLKEISVSVIGMALVLVSLITLVSIL